MKHTIAPIALAVSVAFPALAQQTNGTNAPAEKDAKTTLDLVVVTGIRSSVERSIQTKRNATQNIEVVSAEDVGKMPDKNLADSLQRLPGVAVRTNYDEAEKISLRGANPNLSLVLYNGHTVSGGDWYLTDQSSGARSASMNLVPSAVLSQAQIYKTSQADVVDGGLSGTVNVLMRRALDQKESFNAQVKVGAAYAQLPDKTSPDLSGSIGWKNQDNSFGVLASLFSEKRYMRRDAITAGNGYEFLDTSGMDGLTAAQKADLNGVHSGSGFGVELAEGVRDRRGGTLSLQARLSPQWEVGLAGFYSKMRTTNFGRAEYPGDLSAILGGDYTDANGNQLFGTISDYKVIPITTIYGAQERLLTAATIRFPNGQTGTLTDNPGGAYRGGAYASSGFLDLDATWRPTEALKLKALLSTTRGVGATPDQITYDYTVNGNGFKFQNNGLAVPTFSWIGVSNQGQLASANGTPNPSYTIADGVHDRQKTVDREHSLALDGEYQLNEGIFSTLAFGARYADHHRNYNREIGGRDLTKFPYAAGNWTSYPSNFASGLGAGSNWTNAYWTMTPEAMKAYAHASDDAYAYRRYISSEIDVREQQTAAYAMQSFDADGWSGNFGLRYVRTQVDPNTAQLVAKTTCPPSVTPCVALPDAVLDTFANQYYVKTDQKRTQSNWLPSLNVRWELQRDLIGRLGLSKTISRQNWNVLGNTYSGFKNGTVTNPLTPPTVQGPNPDLKPLIGKNFDASLSWYGVKRQVATVSIFRSNIDGYVKNGIGQTTAVLYNDIKKQLDTYTVFTAGGIKAHIQGVELSAEQPLGQNFGVNANYSYTDSSSADGRPMAGAVRNVANAGLYFENDTFGVRLVYNYTGSYVAFYPSEGGVNNSGGTSSNLARVTSNTAPFQQAAVGTVDLSANYQWDPHLSFSFSAKNLNNPKRYQYRYSVEEFSRVDVSGRQFYLSANYKL